MGLDSSLVNLNGNLSVTAFKRLPPIHNASVYLEGVGERSYSKGEKEEEKKSDWRQNRSEAI